MTRPVVTASKGLRQANHTQVLVLNAGPTVILFLFGYIRWVSSRLDSKSNVATPG